MKLKEQQNLFDDIKWFDSIEAGRDRCGTYMFCRCCDKSERYPCARAAHRYSSGWIRVAVARRKKGGVRV